MYMIFAGALGMNNTCLNTSHARVDHVCVPCAFPCTPHLPPPFRYAYTPLDTDLDDDEEYMVVPGFGQETMKMRTLSSRGQAAPPPREAVVNIKKHSGIVCLCPSSTAHRVSSPRTRFPCSFCHLYAQPTANSNCLLRISLHAWLALLSGR